MTDFYISAAHKSSGKTTIAIGLGAVLSKKYSVQAFKKGPDYIDPIWMRQATGRSVYNLDFYTSSHAYIKKTFSENIKTSQIAFVEGNKGLYDGISTDGSDSNAAMAKLLNLPVILVIDTQGISRGVAPLVHGYQTFDSDIKYKGIILNKVAGPRHEKKLIDAIQEYSDIPVIGSVRRNQDIEIQERHLGLVPSNEICDQAEIYINTLKSLIRESIDLDSFQATRKKCLDSSSSINLSSQHKIAIAQDTAFGFYYDGDLDYFKNIGIELIPFSTINDRHLPENIDGLFIGGGFPETHLEKLSANTTLLSDIKDKITSGLPTYAECGGLMYLCESIQHNNIERKMVGVIPEKVTMHNKPIGRGYVELLSKDSSFTSPQNSIKGHEFHYSSISSDHTDRYQFAYEVKRGTGIANRQDGILMYNLLASYSHLRQTDQCRWIDGFLNTIQQNKS